MLVFQMRNVDKTSTVM
ncbi:TPA: 23S rRNA methyltransferase attenuation leader peptide [Streptococcus agalactiae]